MQIIDLKPREESYEGNLRIYWRRDLYLGPGQYQLNCLDIQGPYAGLVSAYLPRLNTIITIEESRWYTLGACVEITKEEMDNLNVAIRRK